MDKIICLGKNYLEHAKELGDPVPKKPVIFLKPPSVLCRINAGDARPSIKFHNTLHEMHHEIEIVLQIKEDCYQITSQEAPNYIDAVTIGLDMTFRDLQGILKKQGHPWELSKVFPDSAIVGPFVKIADFQGWQTSKFSLFVNNVLRQQGAASEMLMSPFDAIAYASSFFKLCKGDLLFTGTPAGVGTILRGDKATMAWNNISYSLQWE